MKNKDFSIFTWQTGGGAEQSARSRGSVRTRLEKKHELPRINKRIIHIMTLPIYPVFNVIISNSKLTAFDEFQFKKPQFLYLLYNHRNEKLSYKSLGETQKPLFYFFTTKRKHRILFYGGKICQQNII